MDLILPWVLTVLFLAGALLAFVFLTFVYVNAVFDREARFRAALADAEEEMERLYPRLTPEELAQRNAEARAARELVRKRLDGPNGEYTRGVEGLQ